MRVLYIVLGVVLCFQQPTSKPTEPRLDVRAERGLGGMQGEGWQHIALRLENSMGQPVSGRATLYEWESQVGARPRLVLPFVVTDRQVLHFYPFRPPESPQPSTFVITLEGESGKQILYDGAAQFVINGRSTRALRVEMGSAPSGDYHVAIWGETTPFLRNLVKEWNPTVDDLARLSQSRTGLRQLMLRGNSRLAPEAITLENPLGFPDSFIGFGELDVLLALGTDIDQLTERQRRALSDWVHRGGFLVFIPRKKEHLTSPFWRELISIKDQGEVTAKDDSHLRKWTERDGTSHQPIHFLTTVDPPRPIDVTVSYDDTPVVYSVPTGFGRVWIVAMDPESHGGVRRYKPLWLELLNQTVKYRLTEEQSPTSHDSQPWSLESDSTWLGNLGQRFGKSPSVENLAVLILCYLLIIGPANYFVLKRREARLWLIVTVPALAAIFGGVVLVMGFVSHGLRAATNQLELAIVNPEGDRVFTEEYVGVYGTTSAEYRLSFPRHLSLRPLGEFVANPNGGFDNPASFKLVTREDRVWLEDWRLTFWQTRGAAGNDCVLLEGSLTADRNQRTVTISNQTAIHFEQISLLNGARHPLGPLKPFEIQSVTLPNDQPSDSTGNQHSQDQMGAETSAASPDDSQASSEPFDQPEAKAIIEEASRRLGQRKGGWVLGLTRQPIHEIKSPDAKRHLITTLYAWPVAVRLIGQVQEGTQLTPE